MVPHTNEPISSINISSGRDNEEIINDSIRKSKRKYFRDVRTCYCKFSIANSSWRKTNVFHLKMAFFSALRKIIEEPGGPHILDECKFWRKVQLILFWKEKVINDVRTHELLVLDFEIFHFDSYLTKRNLEEVLRTILQEMKDLYRV